VSAHEGNPSLTGCKAGPSFKNQCEGRRSGLPPSNYSEKVARNREPAYYKSPSHISRQRLQFPKAHEPPSAVRPGKANVASAGIDKSGFLKYVPTKQSLYTENERHAPYSTVHVTLRSIYEEYNDS
jgi:hypothetical protein